ncbi:MAG: hypothetical protein BWX80_03712 [Candidatus Hydrogenedentes bacterium ADurb.Bin101]|nr:MAG: hypothetical protein BWX80_03712 [Candidatus Hydrogenedentes bacterium ADurb.Bin101]
MLPEGAFDVRIMQGGILFRIQRDGAAFFIVPILPLFFQIFPVPDLHPAKGLTVKDDIAHITHDPGAGFASAQADIIQIQRCALGQGRAQEKGQARIVGGKQGLVAVGVGSPFLFRRMRRLGRLRSIALVRRPRFHQSGKSEQNRDAALRAKGHLITGAFLHGKLLGIELDMRTRGPGRLARDAIRGGCGIVDLRVPSTGGLCPAFIVQHPGHGLQSKIRVWKHRIAYGRWRPAGPEPGAFLNPVFRAVQLDRTHQCRFGPLAIGAVGDCGRFVAPVGPQLFPP